MKHFSAGRGSAREGPKQTLPRLTTLKREFDTKYCRRELFGTQRGLHQYTLEEPVLEGQPAAASHAMVGAKSIWEEPK